MSLLSKQQILDVLNNSKLELSGFQFSDEIVNRFQDFCSLLQKWNDKINLTSEKNALSILEKHVFDSLQYHRWLDSSHKILDIGSGAGFPGVPLKIIQPDLEITLLESQRKRCSFLREAVRSLKMEKIDVAEGRAEDFFDREAFSRKLDRVVFRGFSAFDTCLSTGLPFLKEGGRIILKKGAQEMPDPALDTFPGARIVDSKTVEGFGGQNSLMIVVEKCST